MRAKKLQAIKLSDVTIPEDYDLRRDGITQSLQSAFQCCPLRFLLAINRWVPIAGESVFEFGNIYHEMLDQSFKDRKAPSKAILKGRLKRYAKKREKELSAVALSEFDRQLGLSEMILQEYYEYYSDDFDDMLIEGPEEIFDVDFEGYRLRGKKDLRFRWKNKDSIWLMEHKTKGRIEEDILEDTLNFDLQNMFYLLADDIQYEEDMENIYYNIIRNPGHKQGKDESFEEYLERIRKQIKKDPSYFFIRYECSYKKPNKKRFREEELIKLNLIEQFLEGFIPFYRNECACKMPFKCQYLKACSSGNLVGYKQQKSLFPELGE